MIVYIIPTLFCIFWIYTYDYRKNQKGKKERYYFLCMYLAIISGLSYKVGGDSGFYMDSYNYIPTFNKLKLSDFKETTYQPLYFLLCVICKSLTPKIWLMHLIQSYIVCYAYFKFIRQNTYYIFTGAFMFMTCIYTYFCYEIYKESLAVSMMILGYRFLLEKKYFKYYFYAFLAILFHFSGVIALLIPFIRKLNINKGSWISTGILLVVITGFQTLVTYFFQSYLFSLSENIITKFDYYTLLATDKFNSNWFLMAFLRNVLTPSMTIIVIKWFYKRIYFEWSFVLYLLLGIGTLQLAFIFDRPLNYALPFVVLSLSDIMGRSYRKHVFKFFTTFVVCFVFWFSCRGWFYAYNEIWRLMIPYESIFYEKTDEKREKVILEIR